MLFSILCAARNAFSIVAAPQVKAIFVWWNLSWNENALQTIVL